MFPRPRGASLLWSVAGAALWVACGGGAEVTADRDGGPSDATTEREAAPPADSRAPDGPALDGTSDAASGADSTVRDAGPETSIDAPADGPTDGAARDARVDAAREAGPDAGACKLLSPAVRWAVAGTQPFAIAAADLDRDGRLDLVVAGGPPKVAGNVSILLGTGGGAFAAPASYAVGLSPLSVVTGDLDGDGAQDLAVADSADQTALAGDIRVLLGHGDGTFAAGVSYGGYTAGNAPSSIVTADFDHDGHADLAAAGGIGSGAVRVLLGKGDGTFTTHVDYAVHDAPSSLMAADFTGDGELDLATVNYNGQDVTVLAGNGDGTFQAAVASPTALNPIAGAAADLDGDGKLDLVIAAFVGNGHVEVMLGNGDGSFRPGPGAHGGYSPYAFALSDLDGDGRVDVAVANIYKATVSVLLGKGGAAFRAPLVFPVGKTPASLGAWDLDGDGTMDLAVVDQDSNDVRVLLHCRR